MTFQVIATSTNPVGRVISNDDETTLMFEAPTEAECQQHILDNTDNPKWPFGEWVEGVHGTISVQEKQ